MIDKIKHAIVGMRDDLRAVRERLDQVGERFDQELDVEFDATDRDGHYVFDVRLRAGDERDRRAA